MFGMCDWIYSRGFLRIWPWGNGSVLMKCVFIKAYITGNIQAKAVRVNVLVLFAAACILNIYPSVRKESEKVACRSILFSAVPHFCL